MGAEDRLVELGIELEPIELEMGRLMHAVRVGNLVYTSGQVSTFGDKAVIGKVQKF